MKTVKFWITIRNIMSHMAIPFCTNFDSLGYRIFEKGFKYADKKVVLAFANFIKREPAE